MKNEEKLMISVIIPCFNQGRYLEQAVQSVLDQTYQNFEIIIINDGSTDKFTNDLLKDFRKPHTRVIKTPNRGLSSTRNYGYSLAKGEYIQFLDADDFLEKNKFELQMKAFQKDKNIDICYTNYKYFFEESGEYVEPNLPVKLSASPFNDFLYLWQRKLSIPIHSAIFRKKIFGASQPFIEGFGATEDWIMWTKLAKQGANFFFINKDLAYYRVHEKSMSHNKQYMLYWASRAIAYIAENFIEEDEKVKFNNESQKYLYQLICILFLNDKNTEIMEYRTQLNKIYDSFPWKFSKKIKKIVSLFKKQGVLITFRNIILKLMKK